MNLCFRNRYLKLLYHMGTINHFDTRILSQPRRAHLLISIFSKTRTMNNSNNINKLLSWWSRSCYLQTKNIYLNVSTDTNRMQNTMFTTYTSTSIKKQPRIKKNRSKLQLSSILLELLPYLNHLHTVRQTCHPTFPSIFPTTIKPIGPSKIRPMENN